MPGPYALDEQGRRMPTYPCPRPGCGREVPVRFTGFRVQYLRHVGWELFRAESFVNWCGHTQEVIPVPRPDGMVGFIPVLGEVR